MLPRKAQDLTTGKRIVLTEAPLRASTAGIRSAAYCAICGAVLPVEWKGSQQERAGASTQWRHP